MSNKRSLSHATTVYRWRSIVNKLMILLSILAFGFALFWLSWMLSDLLYKGGVALLDPSIYFSPTPPPLEKGGLANAIVGSLLMVAVGTFIGTPLGMLAGIYLAEFGHGMNRKIIYMVRFLNDMLLSAPSIVIGLFIYALIVVNTKSFSGWAGSLALSLIVIPVVLRTTDEMLRLVPSTMREAAIALGCPVWRMVWRITLKAARSGIITAILLAVARVSGETAPLLFTALSNQFWSLDMSKPMANLPVVIFQYAMSPYDNWRTLAWGGALLVTAAVLGLNIIARVLTRERR